MQTVRDLPFCDVVKAIHKLAKRGNKMTLLCICPMSEELIRAPIELSAEHGFPMVFVASRNQISEDEGGGYVMGLTQKEFVHKIQDIEGLVINDSTSKHPYFRFVGVDHCGPWYKEREKGLGEKEAIASVKKTLIACLEAGYDVFHIDCTFKPPLHIKMDEAKIIELTVDLIEFVENRRIALGKPAVAYEIGTEETAGLGVTAEHFEKSIGKILSKIEKKNLPKPVLAVGKTGAKIEMLENTGPFDYSSASSLPKLAKKFGLGFKEHNADYLSTPVLSLHPEYDITAANAGPSFAVAQTRALLDLATIEEKEVRGKKSDIYNIMSQAILKKAPFEKWLRKNNDWTVEKLQNMPDELKAVTLIAGHYVYYDSEVEKAIQQLYRNLKEHNIFDDPQAYVMRAVKNAILRYIEAFKLKGSTSQILTVLRGN